MMKVVIDPRCNIYYASYYIKGFFDVLGKRNVSFSMKYFKTLNMKNESSSFDHYFAFVLVENENIYKVIVDFRDKYTVKEKAYQWCDLYAKINFNKQYTPEKYLEKIIAIPPSFGIKLWNKTRSVFQALKNRIKVGSYLTMSTKLFFWHYVYTYRRSCIEDYESFEKSKENYIFFISRIWNHQNCVELTNKLRYQYIVLVKAMKNIIFEGGLMASSDQSENEKYKDAIFTKEYSVDDYIRKTKQSCVVFNTPAVHQCHGWKLGEFLAMGKAIISTSLFNDLSPDLEHGHNIHFADSEEDIQNALSFIVNDSAYKEKLEIGAKTYYNQYASPKAVVRSILFSVERCTGLSSDVKK